MWLISTLELVQDVYKIEQGNRQPERKANAINKSVSPKMKKVLI